jgi:hypothetical protein
MFTRWARFDVGRCRPPRRRAMKPESTSKPAWRRDPAAPAAGCAQRTSSRFFALRGRRRQLSSLINETPAHEATGLDAAAASSARKCAAFLGAGVLPRAQRNPCGGSSGAAGGGGAWRTRRAARVRPTSSTGILFETWPAGFPWRGTDWDEPTARARAPTRNPPEEIAIFSSSPGTRRDRSPRE